MIVIAIIIVIIIIIIIIIIINSIVLYCMILYYVILYYMVFYYVILRASVPETGFLPFWARPLTNFSTRCRNRAWLRYPQNEPIGTSRAAEFAPIREASIGKFGGPTRA